MQLSDAGGQLGARPAPNPTISPGWANNDLTGLTAPTDADPDWMNAVTAELVGILTAAGLTPSKTDVAQVLKSLNQLYGIWAVDTGAANAYVATPNPALTALTAGQQVRMLIAHTNTGASTVNVSGLGAVSIVGRDGTLKAGDLLATTVVWMIYTGAVFQILNKSGYNKVAFTANGSWTVPPGVFSFGGKLWAPGGGGAATNSGATAGGGGGGGGQYGEGVFATTPGTVITLTVPNAGGVGGVTAGANGGNGATASIGSFLTCGGGLGGNANTGAGGSGGNSGSGSLFTALGTTGASSIGGNGAAGGAAPFGGSGGSQVPPSSSGGAPSFPGGGGGGAGTGFTGAAGAGALAIIDWFS